MVSLFFLGTFCCLVDLLASFIINFITSWCYSESNEDQAIRKELISLKREMASISMVDEFARYAKLQRKFIKLQNDVKDTINIRSTARTKLKLSIATGIRVLNGIFTSVLLYLYRREPVVFFPTGTLWPLESILSWPTAVNSCISLPLWIILMRLTVSSCKKLISA